MKLYNTLSRTVEEFRPQLKDSVSVYTCGPTVYDTPHIGNWFAFLRWDILVRTLKASGYKPNWIMNITDVGHLVSDADEGEDKLEVGAKREGKSAWDIAKHYTEEFMSGLQILNFISPTAMPKATDHITEQIELIKVLENKGFTYSLDDGIYFDTSKFKNYGQLAKLDLEHLKVGARVETNPDKKNPSDFALWKFSPKDQKRDMEWDSPWGMGFPGWHIECSAMSMKYLGETLDIHGGGIDHLPIHHTNEIAQSEGATGKTFVNYWVHSNFILVDGKKMSKSLNNYYTLSDITKRNLDPLAFRLLVLQSHYRTESHFSWDNLSAAQTRLKGYQAMADLRFQAVGEGGDNQSKMFKDFQQSLLNSLANDLDTPQALEQLSILANTLSETLVAKAVVDEFKELLTYVDELLGLQLMSSPDIGRVEQQLLESRQAHRNQKNWEAADKDRQALENVGLGVRDTPSGQIWFRL